VSRARSIMRDSVAVGMRQLLVLGLTIGQSLYAAQYLGPQGFGTYGLVTILTLAAAIVTPGFLSAAARELPHHRSLGDEFQARAVVRHMVLGEMAMALLWTIVILVFALTREDPNLHLLLLIAAASVIPAKLASVYQVLAICDTAFAFQARVEVIRTVLTAVLVIGGISYLGLPLLLAAPIAGSLLAAVLYGRRYVLFDGLRQWRREEFVRLARIGLPMAGLNVVSGNAGAQRWLERLLIQQRLGTESVGLYTFASWVALQLLTMLGSIAQAIQPHLYDILARNMDVERVRHSLARPVWLMTMVAALFLGGTSCVLPYLIHALVPAYMPALPSLQVLQLGVFLSAAYWIPAIVLYSVRVNGQTYYFLIWTLAVALSAVVAWAALVGGHGLVWVAWGFVASQLLLLVLTFRRVSPWLFPGQGDMSDFLRSLALPLLNVVLALVVAHVSSSLWPVDGAWSSAISALAAASIYVVLSVPAVLVMVRRSGLLDMLQKRRARMTLREPV